LILSLNLSNDLELIARKIILIIGTWKKTHYLNVGKCREGRRKRLSNFNFK
jgi:hypothetical protein